LQLLYLPSELDIDKQIQQVTLYFYCMQYQYHPVIPTITTEESRDNKETMQKPSDGQLTPQVGEEHSIPMQFNNASGSVGLQSMMFTGLYRFSGWFLLHGVTSVFL
jgi:hypothetical protein